MADQREHAGAGSAASPAELSSGVRQDSTAPSGRRSRGWRVVFVVAATVFVVAVVALGAIAFSYWQGQHAYRQAADEAFSGAVLDSPQPDLASVSVDWDALSAINPDTVGWIYVPGTPCNYPIVHTTDDSTYLSTDFYGGKGWLAQFGCIFLSSQNAPDFSDANNVVFGHHMNDGSMFGFIDGLFDAASFNGTRDVYLLTPEGNLRLRTFAVLYANANDPIAQTSFATPEDFQAYVQDKAARSSVVVDPQIDLDAVDRIFSFVTCDNVSDEGREVLFAAVVEESGAPSGNDPQEAVQAAQGLAGA